MPAAAEATPSPLGSTAQQGKGGSSVGLWQWTSPELRRGQFIAWDTGDASGAHVYLRDPSAEREILSALEPVRLIGWWPQDSGLLAWHWWGYCNSCNADGLRLAVLTLDGHLTDLANVDVQAGGYSWSPSGRRLLIGTGGDRFVIYGDPHILVCDFPSSSCSALPRPAGQLDLTPGWSPDGRFVTFARGSAPQAGNNLNATVAAWQDTLGLWIARADGTGQKLLNTPGGSYPTWSADGRSIYFVHGGQRWRHDLYTGENVDTGEPVIGHEGRGWVTYSQQPSAS